MLPSWGKFKGALDLDPDYARHIFEQQKEAEAEAEEAAWFEENDEDGEPIWHKPKLRSREGFRPELQALFNIDERLQSLGRLMIMVNSKSKPPDIQKTPRPFTALDMLELEFERDDMQEFASRFGLRKKPN